MKKNSQEAFTIQKALLAFLVFFVCFTVIRFVEVAAGIDAATGFFKQSSPLHGLFYALVILACAVLAVYSYLSKPASQMRTVGFRSVAMCVMAVLLGLAFLGDGIASFGQISDLHAAGGTFRERMSSGELPLTLRGIFGFLSAVYTFLLAHAYRTGKTTAAKARILALSPICWAAFRMVHHFVRKISFTKVSDLFFELLMLGAMLLFFMAFASVTSGIYSEGTAWRLCGFGLPAALIAGMLSLPRLVFMLIDKEAYINANHPFQAVDCIFFCFVLLLCITVLRNPAAPAVEETAAEE